jgi:hypothetical protein
LKVKQFRTHLLIVLGVLRNFVIIPTFFHQTHVRTRTYTYTQVWAHCGPLVCFKPTKATRDTCEVRQYTYDGVNAANATRYQHPLVNLAILHNKHMCNSWCSEHACLDTLFLFESVSFTVKNKAIARSAPISLSYGRVGPTWTPLLFVVGTCLL